MSNQVTTAYVKQFQAGIRMLQQQKMSRLREAVIVDNTVVGDRAFYDQVDSTNMSQVTNRHGDTTYTDTPHRRRMVTMDTFDVADLVDRHDERRLLNNPINAYSRSMAASANRQIDDVIFPAFDATASTGVDGADTAIFPAAFSFAESGGAGGFSIDDMLQARALLEAAENEEDDGDNSWHAALSADGRNKLLQTTEIPNADFNTVKALVQGQIDTFIGFNFIKSQRSQIDGSSIRDTFFWVKISMMLAIAQEAMAFIDPLPTKRHSLQVRYEIDAGATRMDEVGVVRILTSEV
jgi:hypothetical protein